MAQNGFKFLEFNGVQPVIYGFNGNGVTDLHFQPFCSLFE